MTARKKAKPKAYHHGDLRRALLDAARAEIHRAGVRALSLRGVARRAGVSHAAAYHHFADKNALLARIAQEGFEKLDAAMHEEMDRDGNADAVGRIIAAGTGYIRFAQADPQALALMFETEEVIDEDCRVAGERAFTTLVATTAAARASRALEGDPIPYALLHWSFVHGYATLARNGRFTRLGITDVLGFGTALSEHLESLYPKRST